MELTEKIETLNQRLTDEYGLDSDSGQPIFRIVWSDDQHETRKVEASDAGVQYLFPQVREVPKYSYIVGLWVLERLVAVPEIHMGEIFSKLSYEPLWVYCNEEREYRPPTWNATKFVIDTVYAALGKKSMAKYVDDEKNTTPEGREQRVDELQGELFGNETNVGDALAYKTGIVVPGNDKIH